MIQSNNSVVWLYEIKTFFFGKVAGNRIQTGKARVL